MIIHEQPISGGGEPDKEMDWAVVDVVVLIVAAAAESVASETADGESAEGGEAASGEIPGGEAPSGASEREAADAEEGTADGRRRGSNSRKVVTLVPTRRRRKWESNSLMVKNLVNRRFKRGMMIDKRSDKTEGIRNRMRWIKGRNPENY